MTGDPRIGFCCTFQSPIGDAEEERRMNMRTTTIAHLMRLSPGEAFDKLSGIVAHNLDTLDNQLGYIAGLPPLERMFRILSGIFPGYSHADVRHYYDDADLKALIERRLAAAGAFAREQDIRLSMHPGQHAILATLRPEALANAIADVMEHVAIMTMLGFGGGWHPHGAHVNIHGGSRAAGIEGLCYGIAQLPEEARNLVTLENDETSFGLNDLLAVKDEIAIVVDFHHHWVFTQGEYLEPDDPRIADILASWRGVRPAAHISVSREALVPHLSPFDRPDYAALSAEGFKAAKLRGHSDMMWNLAVNDLVASHLGWCDVEVEAKAKNLASAQLADHVRARRAS